jgi:hypothetical protein
VLAGAITKTNADSSIDTFGGGAGQISADSTPCSVTVGQILSATVTPIPGAYAYAWFLSSPAGAGGSARLHQITTINSATFSTLTPAGNQAITAFAADNSTNALIYDGILTMIPGSSFGQTSNAYVATMATGTAGTGSPLTSDGATGIVEIDKALKSFWDNYRLSPTEIFINSQEAMNINKKVIGAGGTPLFRFVMDDPHGIPGLTLTGGSMVGSYLNKFMGGGRLLPLTVHPWMPAGTIVFWSDKVPYSLSDVTNIVQIKARQEYYQIEWPLKSRKYEFGVYVDELFQCYFPPAFGMITNIGNG